MKAKNLKVECISRNDESLLQIAIDDFMLMNEDCEIDSVSFNVNTGASQFWYSALIFYRQIPEYKKGNPFVKIISGLGALSVADEVNEFLIKAEIEMVSIEFTEIEVGFSAYIMYHAKDSACLS